MVTVREDQPTANGFDASDKVVTVTTCLAGDTLVIYHGSNANPFPADPTSSAGTLTQQGTITNAFAGRCRLRVYTCPVATTGSKTVTFPVDDGAGGGDGDNHGHVIVIAGGVSPDGAVSTNGGVDSGAASHIINAVSPTGAAALLTGAVAAFSTAAAANYWDPSGSGMTEGAESFDTNFLALWSGYQQLSASGSTGTRSITPVTSDNRYVSLGMAVSPAGITQALGAATETDTAIALGRLKTRALGPAAETDSAVSLGRLKTRALGVAVEVDTAGAVGRVKRLTLGVAGETDTAAAFGRTKTGALGVAVETDTALPLGGADVELPGVLVAAGTSPALIAAGTAATLTASGTP